MEIKVFIMCLKKQKSIVGILKNMAWQETAFYY